MGWRENWTTDLGYQMRLKFYCTNMTEVTSCWIFNNNRVAAKTAIEKSCQKKDFSSPRLFVLFEPLETAAFRKIISLSGRS